MTVYLTVMTKAIRQRLIYKGNAWVQILGSVIKILIQVSIWSALLGTGSTKGITFADMVNYVLINMVMMALVYSHIAGRLAEKMQDGTIALDFIRPVHLKYYLVAEQIGFNFVQTVFYVLPICVVTVLFYRLNLVLPSIRFLLFASSTLQGIVIIFQIQYILGLLSFWFKTSFYTDWFHRAFFQLFGGTIVPLWFYPSWLAHISNLLPFRLVTFEPIAIYLGKVSLSEAIGILVLQFVWIVILYIVEGFVWAKAQRVITVQGG